jgi:hypothetical protein
MCFRAWFFCPGSKIWWYEAESNTLKPTSLPPPEKGCPWDAEHIYSANHQCMRTWKRTSDGWCIKGRSRSMGRLSAVMLINTYTTWTYWHGIVWQSTRARSI